MMFTANWSANKMRPIVCKPYGCEQVNFHLFVRDFANNSAMILGLRSFWQQRLEAIDTKS